jgi:hypothetical protein
MADRLLRIYLNDHLTGASMIVRVIRRSARANRGSELGAFLEELFREVVEDRAALRRLMDELGVRPNPAKQGVAVVAERLGLLKLNGSLTGYSDLSRVLELEGMTMGVAGKLSLWECIAATQADPAARAGLDLEALQARARSQLERLAPHRRAAAGRAFPA